MTVLEGTCGWFQFSPCHATAYRRVPQETLHDDLLDSQRYNGCLLSHSFQRTAQSGLTIEHRCAIAELNLSHHIVMKIPLPILAMALISSLVGAHADEVKLKKIAHRGGVVEFSIPSNWKVESENDGGGIYYDDSPDSGTLRLSVVTAKSPTSINDKSASEFLRGLRQAQSRQIESLTNGNALLHYSESATESGNKLHVVYWIVANPVRPDHIRIATFSYTLLEGQQEQQRFKKELALIDSQVRKASFSKELGETKSK